MANYNLQNLCRNYKRFGPKAGPCQGSGYSSTPKEFHVNARAGKGTRTQLGLASSSKQQRQNSSEGGAPTAAAAPINHVWLQHQTAAVSFWLIAAPLLYCGHKSGGHTKLGRSMLLLPVPVATRFPPSLAQLQETYLLKILCAITTWLFLGDIYTLFFIKNMKKKSWNTNV